jgi:hypothetical protein
MGGRGRGRGRGAVPPSVASASFNFGSSNGPSSTTGIHTSRTEPSQKFPVKQELYPFNFYNLLK